MGATLLFKLGWLSIRHDRSVQWPVYQPEDWNPNNITPIRHHFDEVPPYNYKGIDEHIDCFNASSDSNSYFLDEQVESKGSSSKDEQVCCNFLKTKLYFFNLYLSFRAMDRLLKINWFHQNQKHFQNIQLLGILDISGAYQSLKHLMTWLAFFIQLLISNSPIERDSILELIQILPELAVVNLF